MTKEIDDVLDEPSTQGGVYGLWLHVFLLSVLEIRCDSGNTAAQAFLLDPDNDFFILWPVN